jgi:hypothetical protein
MVPGSAWCSEPFDVYLDGIAVEVHATFELAVGKLHLGVEEFALTTPFVHEAETFFGEEVTVVVVCVLTRGDAEGTMPSP